MNYVAAARSTRLNPMEYVNPVGCSVYMRVQVQKKAFLHYCKKAFKRAATYSPDVTQYHLRG